jgi:hypothetical protein
MILLYSFKIRKKRIYISGVAIMIAAAITADLCNYFNQLNMRKFYLKN